MFLNICESAPPQPYISTVFDTNPFKTQTAPRHLHDPDRSIRAFLPKVIVPFRLFFRCRNFVRRLVVPYRQPNPSCLPGSPARPATSVLLIGLFLTHSTFYHEEFAITIRPRLRPVLGGV